MREDKNDDEINIDFSKIKSFFKGKNKQEKVKKVEGKAEAVKEKIENEIQKEEHHIKELKEEEQVVENISENLKYQEESAKEADLLSENVDDEITKEKKQLKSAEEKINPDNEADDEINIDFSKVKSFFKKIKDNISDDDKQENDSINKEKREYEQKVEGEVIKEKEPLGKSDEKEDDEINIDFSKIKSFFKKSIKLLGEKNEKDNKEPSDDDEISINWRKFSNFFKKNKYAIPIVLILIAIFFSTFFRMYPAYLPVTDEWAANSVYNGVRSNIRNQINQQYPNLPDANKNQLVETQFKEILKQQGPQIDTQIQGTSNYFKSRLQDDSGQTYLLAIDPYLWYGEARNYIRNGYFRTKVDDDKGVNFHRNGRVGISGDSGSVFHLYFEVFLYKFTHFFNKNASLMGVVFVIPVILIGLSVIPAFFIGKRVGGNVGGFFASMIVAINSALLSRTPAGFVDTDSYNIFFPLFIAWLFLEAFESHNIKKQLIYALLSGLLVGLFSSAWGGWWYVFDFIVATLGIYFVYLFILNIGKFSKLASNKSIKELIITGGTFLLSSALFISLFNSFDAFLGALRGPLNIITLKDVAVTSYWPNVLTTVAEFNVVGLNTIMSQMGGRLLFYIGILGIILTLIKKDKYGKRDVKYTIFLAIWFLGTLYGFTKGIRFGILMVPAFAVAFGIALGIIYNNLNIWLSKGLHINKNFSKFIVILIFLLLLINPIKAAQRTALNEIPSMNDAWYESLIAIKEASDDAIITSWWDFGHWFVAVSERRVTFDGADQGERIHWVGKSLLTADETLSVGILRMLNCGQEQAPHVLEKYLNNDTVKAIDILNEIMVENKEDAISILDNESLTDKEIEEVIKFTHCEDLIDQYYITSEDMVGKAGVWGHFGSWDFKKAKMWQEGRSLDFTEGTKLLREEYEFSEQDADSTYYDIQNNDADRWISPWPGYLSGQTSCSEKDNYLRCGNGMEINLTDMKSYVSTQQGKVPLKSLAFINDKKEFELIEYDGESSQFSGALLPNGNTIVLDPLLAGSMFTRMFFFNGHGLKHFQMFSDKRQITGGRIQVWNVSFEAGEPIVLPQYIEKTNVKKGDEISAYYIGWTNKNGIFDSSIIDWKALNITERSMFEEYNNTEFKFNVGSGQVIPGFDKGVINMIINSTKIIEMPPEEGYGLDPNAHALGNKTLFFKIKIVGIK